MGDRPVSERLNLGQEGAVYAGKMAAGAGISAFGVMTLNDWALVFGMVCSVVITVQTLLNIFWKWRDRANRPTHNPANE